MKRTPIAWMAALALLAACPHALAATAETADSSGAQPIPVPTSTAETGWNPQIQCTVETEDSVFDLLECLGAGIDPTFPCYSHPTPFTTAPSGSSGHSVVLQQNPPQQTYCPYARQDYWVSWLPAPRIGIQILRTDGSEVDSLFLRENDPNIQWTTLQVQRPGMVARIGEIQEAPSGGIISVRLNDRLPPIDVETTGMQAADVNSGLVGSIMFRGFRVRHESPYIVVSFDRNNGGSSLTKVSFRSTDPQIVRSELRLEPPSEGEDQGEFIQLPGGRLGP